MRPEDRALIVQSDGSLLVDVHVGGYAAARDALAPFAHLEKAPEHLHTYRITPVSLWNAAAAGFTAAAVRGTLEAHARYGIPPNVLADIEDQMSRWGKLVLDRAEDGRLRLAAHDDRLVAVLARYSALKGMLEPDGPGLWWVGDEHRGEVKQLLARVGYPVVDLAGYTDGAALPVTLRNRTLTDKPFELRGYQHEAIQAFLAGGGSEAERAMGGHGVVVLPCGAGKTIVALGLMAELDMHTLILATGTTAVRQWISETLDKTTLTEDDVGEYTGQKKEVKPVTVATYQIATRGRHRSLFSQENWGLIIYDEVHLLPAPLFRTTAELQARRRLGLTATLVREDGKEAEVFSLIGPKRFEVPWKVLEAQGFVAVAECFELRVPGSNDLMTRVLLGKGQDTYRVAAENEAKDAAVEDLVAEHEGDRILVIGQYLDQLQRLSQRLDAPFLSGETPQEERDRLFAGFRSGEVPVLVVSRVANFSVDLPDASVLIQVSGLFGSRQEEAQRLGRILRPKADGRPARFYTLVTRDTPDQEFALRRQRFLTEQGYAYHVMDWDGAVPEERSIACNIP